MLIAPEALAERLDEFRIFDATVALDRPPEGGPYVARPRREDYLAGHIPGAAFADLVHDFADPDAPFPFARAERRALRGRRRARTGSAGRLGGDLLADVGDVGDAAVVAAALLRVRRRRRARRRADGLEGGGPAGLGGRGVVPRGVVRGASAAGAAGHARGRRGDRGRRARVPGQHARPARLPRRGPDVLQPPRPDPGQRQRPFLRADRPGDAAAAARVASAGAARVLLRRRDLRDRRRVRGGAGRPRGRAALRRLADRVDRRPRRCRSRSVRPALRAR